MIFLSFITLDIRSLGARISKLRRTVFSTFGLALLCVNTNGMLDELPALSSFVDGGAFRIAVLSRAEARWIAELITPSGYFFCLKCPFNSS